MKLDKDSQKANWSKRPLTKRLLDYASLDVWHLPALRDLLLKQLTKLGRREWLEQQCRKQIADGSEGFAPPGKNDWRIGHSERLRGKGLSLLHAVWHWRQQQAERLDTPPFKVCSNDVLLKLAHAGEEGNSEETILATVHLGKRHPRLQGSLAAAVRAGLERDPQTLPRRARRDSGARAPDAGRDRPARPHQGGPRQDRREARDRIDPDRQPLPARANRPEPRQLDAILLPWQANLLRDIPSLRD